MGLSEGTEVVGLKKTHFLTVSPDDSSHQESLGTLGQHGAKSEEMVQLHKMLLIIVPGLCDHQCGGGESSAAFCLHSALPLLLPPLSQIPRFQLKGCPLSSPPNTQRRLSVLNSPVYTVSYYSETFLASTRL